MRVAGRRLPVMRSSGFLLTAMPASGAALVTSVIAVIRLLFVVIRWRQTGPVERR